jgi:hypothetical protein
MVVTNGHTDANLRDMGRDSPYEHPPLLWHNIKGRFSYVGGAAAGEYFNGRHVGRGLAVADLDNDGDLDLVIVHQDARPALLRNDHLSSAEDGWIRVQLIGRQSNRDAVGAELRWDDGDGGLIIQQIKGGGSYLCAHDPRQVLALPTAAPEIKLMVQWPSGRQTEPFRVEVGNWYRLVEP